MEDKKKSQLLVVDDELSVRDILQRSLINADYDCKAASSADEALHILKADPVQLVLSDIMMPGRSGIELLGEIRKQYPDVMVIMVTAVSDTDTAIGALRLGAYDYITKPFNIDDVVITVKRAIEKRNLEIANREYRDHLEKKVEEQTEKIRDTFFGAITALAGALEAKDRYTHGHSQRVTEISLVLAEEMKLSSKDIERIDLAGRVHDIGKIGIPEGILLKPGKLTVAEFAQVEQHPELSEQILCPVIKDKRVLSFVRHHHERYGGGGYPDGLEGEEIPLGARLLAVADAYDAMTSDRPYRDALPLEKATQQLLANRGNQFDPEIVDKFVKIHEKLRLCHLV